MIRYLVDHIEQYTSTEYNKCIRIHPDVIRYYDLTFVLKGHMVYRSNGMEYMVRKNDAIFLRPGTLRERDYEEIDVKYVSYNFYLAEGVTIDLPEYMPSIVTEEIRQLLASFPFPQILGSHYDQEKCSCVLNAVLYELINLYESPPKNKYVRLMLQYINTHITENISLADLCLVTYLSKEYCAYLFKANVGKSIISYVNDKKMRYAKELIIRNEMSLGDIAAYLGFDDYNYFSRLYKRTFGCPPRKTVNRSENSEIVAKKHY